MNLAELEQEIEALQAEKRRQRLAGFDDEVLLWLAMVPVWSEELARACGLPTGAEDLAGLLDRAEAVRLIERDRQRGQDACERFWMLDEPRGDVVARWRERGLASERLARMGQAVLAHAGQVEIPVSTWRWAELTSRLDRDAAPWLRRKIESLIDAQCTAEARDWLEMADRMTRIGLSDMVDIVAVVRLGRYRLERAHRHALDEHELVHFLPRAEQIQAFRALLDGPDELWALHYLGMGGMGKTTLIRYIAARLSPERRVPVSRVDFDYLSPDYPVRKPGQLIAALAGTLGAYVENATQERYLESLHDQLLTLHENIAGEVQPEDPLDNIRRDEFERLLAIFAELVRTLPGPVILVLDTCEEIAKLSPAGGRLPSVEATFEILERVHARVPSLRVVIAGRRLLTRAGHGWRARPETLSEIEAQLPARKEYLRMHVIRGFTEAESRRFLRERRGLGDDMPIDKILAHSPEPGWPRMIENETEDDAGHRYGPFDLSLYADLVTDEPELGTAGLGQRDTDPYIEIRIIRRMGDLAPILPAVALLERFDRDMLALVTGPDTERIFAELGAQEWIDTYTDEAGGGGFLEVKRPLQARLLEHYRHPDRRSQLDAACAILAAGLDRLVRERPLGKLGVAHIDAALRLCAGKNALALWRELELRIPGEADWSWAFNVTRELLGDDGAAGKRDSALHPSVLATYTSACIHQQTVPGIAPLWNTVLARFAGTDLLLERAMLGIAAASAEQDAELAALEPARLWQRLADEIGSSHAASCMCAAIEGMLERAERAYDAGLLPWQSAELRTWLHIMEHADVDPGLLAFARCLLGRAELLASQWDAGRAELLAVLAAADSISPERPRDRWLDWREPACLRDRVRLEALRLLGPHGHDFGMATLTRWLSETQTRIDNIDSERLAARIWLTRHAVVALDPDVLRSLRPQLRYVSRRRPTCRAHEVTPPLFAVIARALIDTGAGDDGEALAREHLEAAMTAADNPQTVRAAEDVLLHLARRMRLPDRAASLIGRLATSSDPMAAKRAQLAAAVNARTLPAESLLAGDPPTIFTPLGPFPNAFEPDPGQAHPDSVELALRRALRSWARQVDASGAAWMSRFAAMQPRLLAECAFEEGEILALVEPGAGYELLVQAAHWFRLAGDYQGIFISTVSAHSIRRADSEDTSDHAVALVREAHDELRGHGIDPSTSIWAGWQARFQACMATLDTRQAPSPAAAPKNQRPGQRYLEDTARPSKPSELKDLIASTLREEAPRAPADPNLFSKGTPMGSVSKPAMPLAQSSAPAPNAPSRPRSPSAGAAPAVERSLAYASKDLAPQGLLLEISQLAPGEAGYKVLRYPGEKIERQGAVAIPQPQVSYEAAAEMLSIHVQTLLASVDKTDGRIDLPMNVDRRVAALSWEAYVALRSGARLRAANPYRIEVGSVPLDPASWRDGVVCLITSNTWRERIGSSWRSSSEITTKAHSGEHAVLHVIGQPVKTSAGVKLRIEDSNPRIRNKLTRDPLTSETDLPFTTGWLAVIQANPLDGVRRSEIERGESYDLREFAATAFDTGARAILMLPALPLDIAQAAIDTLAHAFRRDQPPSRADLVAAAHAVRQVILDTNSAFTSPDIETARWEMAFDVTLFVRG